MKPIIITGVNQVTTNSDGNVFEYNFIGGGINLNESQVALSSIHLFYSWFNINHSKYRNAILQYKWFDGITYYLGGANGQIADGFYTVKQLNEYLQFCFLQNGHYMIDVASGLPVYFMNISTNSVYYSVQIDLYPLSIGLKDSNNWTRPPGQTWIYPSEATTFDLIIPPRSVSTICDILGYLPSTSIPSTPQSSLYTINSTVCPQVSPVNSILVECSLAFSPYSNPSNIIYAFSPNVSFGSMISSQPATYAFCDCQAGIYNKFTVRLLDQNLQPIKINDPSIVINLLIKNKLE
jgi:hypothetical protein